MSKLSTKNIAYPGSPYFYEQLLLNNKHLYNNEKKFIIFYFEGNDFNKKKKKKKKFRYKDLPKIFYKAYTDIEDIKDLYLRKIYNSDQVLFRIIRHNSLKLNIYLKNFFKTNFYNDKSNQQNFNKVRIEYVDDIPTAFFNEYVNYSKSNKFDYHVIKNQYLLDKILTIVFIPTKFTVYSEFLNEKVNDNKFKSLKKSYSKYNISVLDLTPALKKKALEIIVDKKLVYWKDDTHWNEHGIKTSMEFLYDYLKKNKSNFN